MNIVIMLAAALIFFGPTLLRAQSDASEQPISDQAKTESPDSKAQDDLKLTDVTRVSTADAARGAARDIAKKRSGNAKNEPYSPDVFEFQPVEQGSRAATETMTTSSKKSKKPPFKSVHGSVYGSADPSRSAKHGTAAEVGATSKSGKTAVYVETEQGHNSSPSPH